MEGPRGAGAPVDAAPGGAPQVAWSRWMGAGRRKVLVRVLRVTMLSALAKGSGFLVPIVVAAGFGAGVATDSYFLAYAAVILAGASVGSALENSTLPDAARALRSGRTAAAHRLDQLARRGLGWGAVSMLGGGLVLAIGLAVAAPSGVAPARVLLMYALLSPIPVAMCVSGTFSGALVAAGKLELSVVSNGLRGVGALVGAVAASFAGSLWPLAIGLGLGELARTTWLRGHWRRALARLEPGADPAPGQAASNRSAFRQVVAQLLVAGGPLVERFLIGDVGAAAVSRVEYAARLLWVASVVFDGGIGPYLLSRWASQRAAGTLQADWPHVFRPLTAAAALAASIGLAIVVFAPLVVAIVLDHGAFTSEDTQIVTALLRWYGVGFVFSMIAGCSERLLLACGDSSRFLRLSAVRVAVRLGVVLLAVAPLGLVAAPCGYLISEIAYASLLLLTIATARTWRGTR
jgi:putative peptidoglycan lipid II flippase